MIEVIQFFQSFSTPLLDKIFLFISALTGEYVFVLILGYLYWCYDKNRAYGIGVVTVSALMVNVGLKNIFKIPRPFHYSSVRQIDTQTGYGYSFPSGHSQLTMAFTGICHYTFRKKIILTAGLILTLLTGISRIYLGVHTPVDVLCGFAVGIVCVMAGKVFMDNLKYKNRISLIIAVVIWVVAFLIKDNDLYKMGGFFTAFIAGHILDEKILHFETVSGKGRKIVSFIGGMVLVAVAKLAVEKLGLPSAVQYAAAGFVVSFVAPALFQGVTKFAKRR